MQDARKIAINLYANSPWEAFLSKFKFWEEPSEVANKMLPNNGKIIDLGCGEGLLSNYLAIASPNRKIIGIEKEIIARIPSKELLIVMKLHSGRLTDMRDIAALAKDTNIETIRKFLFIGNKKALQRNLDKLEEVVKHKNFIDSFKGVFIEKKFDIDMKQVERIAKLTQ